jgi:trimethylamine--corrinoid protein Co-methyltransferase
MTDRMQIFEGHELDLIHDAAMEILGRTGVRFHSAEALALFQQHGFRSDGRNVFFTETDVKTALEKVPSRFTVRAINRENDVAIGGDDFVLLPTGGAPNVSACNGGQRPATLEDYHTCCKLVQTSDQLDMNGCLMVQPRDLPPETAHLDMLFANMVMCDKAYVGAAMFRAAAIDSLEMAAIAWGGKDGLSKAPVMAAIVSAT